MAFNDRELPMLKRPVPAFLATAESEAMSLARERGLTGLGLDRWARLSLIAPGLAHWAISPNASGAAEWLSRTPLGHRDIKSMEMRSRQLIAQGFELAAALRTVRNETMVGLCWSEHMGEIGLEASAAVVSALARWSLAAALRQEGNRMDTVVFGMGKLSGGELNPGSDVDLVFLFDEKLTSATEAHRKARLVTRTLSEISTHGLVFRTDLRLRPGGSQGSVSLPVEEALSYFEGRARPWERAVWLRSTPVGGNIALGRRFLKEIRPFVFPKRVDPLIAHELDSLLHKSRVELRRDHDRHIKLGRGGIREAEFFVQALQLTWGGQHPALQVPNTIKALRALVSLGFVRDTDAALLEASWARLRRLEHQIQFLTGYQTHELPSDPIALETLAWAIGFEGADAMLGALNQDRDTVNELWRSLHMTRGSESDLAIDIESLKQQTNKELEESLFANLNSDEAAEAATHLARLLTLPVSPFSDIAISQNFRCAEILAHIIRSESAHLILRNLVGLLQRTTSKHYGARLLDDRQFEHKLLGLFGTAPMLSQALLAHPEDLDVTLASDAPTTTEISLRHEQIEKEVFDSATSESEEFAQSALRRLKRLIEVETALAFEAGRIDLRRVWLNLSTLAECQIAAAMKVIAHSSPLPVGVELVCVAFGKLGSKELGFRSDLDLVFVFQSETQSDASPEHVARFVRKTLRLLSDNHFEGPGYKIDARLRPTGTQGILVTPATAFIAHHSASEPWERLAVLRARPLGNSKLELSRLGAAVSQSLRQVISDAEQVSIHELGQLRAKIHDEFGGEQQLSEPKVLRTLNLKTDAGGMLDIEFIAALGQQRQKHPLGSTETALHELGDQGFLTRQEANALRQAYRRLRRIEYGLRLYGLDTERSISLSPSRLRLFASWLNIRDRNQQIKEEIVEALLEQDLRTVLNIYRRLEGG